MKNREVFQRDPSLNKLLNDGVAAVNEAVSEKEIETLRYELEHFVCEGQYKSGLVRILESYIENINSPAQRAAWVSGFYGSGKSHLLKMFRHLWVNTSFPSDGASARGIAHLTTDITDALKELDILGKRYGGLHAASGTLPSGGGESVRLAVLGIIFKSKGLPEVLPQAQFCLWLTKNGIFDKIKKAVGLSGKDFANELHDMYVSPALAKALLDVDPTFAGDLKQARAALREQYPLVEDISTSEFIRIFRETLTVNGQVPCTVIVLDEMQLFIGDSTKRSTDIQDVAEALCKQLDSRVLLIGAGQTALAGNVPLLQRLVGRFTIPVELSDMDVETVTRRVVLEKKADKRKDIEDLLDSHSGEIDRQLSGTKIGKRSEDAAIIVEDYPLLPVRRRFWENVLRAVDPRGVNSQLRTQLKIVYDSVRITADKSLGNVIAGDYIFDQLQPILLRTSILLQELDLTIRSLDNGTPEGILSKRLCGLIFLIRKLSRDPVADIGVRATPDMLADLLVCDLANEGITLRKEIPQILDNLVEKGKLIKIDEEYSLQTRESNEWDREFRNRQGRLNNDMSTFARKRTELITAACGTALDKIKSRQGKSKEPRNTIIHFGAEAPDAKGSDIPIWIRDGWGASDSTVLSDARAAGNDSPVIFIFIPKASASDLQKVIVDYESARSTIEIKGTPSTAEGREARDAMVTRMNNAEAARNTLLRDIINSGHVFQGGGSERYELTLEEKVREAANVSLTRLFPQFKEADDSRWTSVINRAKNGDETALQHIDWKDAPEKHPVLSAVLADIGSGKKGKDIRDTFKSSPYGWPQDAIDAALITLFTTGHIRAINKGQPLSQGQLDQAKISVTDFRAETITIDARSRIKLRGLFQAAGVPCKPNEEIFAGNAFLDKLGCLASSSSGNPPLPARPDLKHIEDLKGRSGNDLLDGILKSFDILEAQLKTLAELAETAAKRLPAWSIVSTLLNHARIIPEAQELLHQAEAITNERQLLQNVDPIPSIVSDLSALLRKELKKAHSQYADVFNNEMIALQNKETWKKLIPDQQNSILAAEGITCVPALSIQDNNELIQSLAVITLPVWQTKTDALPQQFGKAAISAARLLEPKVQTIKISSGTIRTETDLDAWLAESKKRISGLLKNGPVMLS
jgi:hypothetical protein